MSGTLRNINAAEFENEVLKHDGLTLVDFWASWCGPCRMLAPTLERVQSEMGDKVQIVKVNVEENPQLAQTYKIQNIPFMLLLKNGEVVGQLLGNRPKSDITAAIEKAL